MSIYVLRANFGQYTDAFKNGSYIGIGWLDKDKLDKNVEKEQVDTLYQKYYPDHLRMQRAANVGQIVRFIHDIKIGDIVITPYANNELLVGEVKSDLYYENDNTSPYPHRKKIDWFPQTIDRKIFSIPLQNSLRSSLTCFKIRQEIEILEALGKKTKEIKQEEKTSTDLYENIRQKFLNLDASEFELLVSYVLQSVGFEAYQKTGSVGDGGIDYEGNLEVLGIASIKLQVQVKRYDKTTIKESDIRNFRGALKRDYQGCFISLSEFNKKAYESANDPHKVPVNIIDGKKFVEIFIEEYDEIMDTIYLEENEELADKLRFKKTLLPI